MAKQLNTENSEQGKGRTKAGMLSRRSTRSLAKAPQTLTIGRLEAKLLKAFPKEDAEAWDRTGLIVGEADLPVSKVAVTLDPTVSAIKRAAAADANVLITHHPPFLEAPASFSPERSVALSEGAGVWAAIQNRVALMCFHTALDVSKQAQVVLPNLLGLTYKGKVLMPLEGSKTKGYGQVCSVGAKASEAQTLSHLAAKCVSVFGRSPRVWGDFNKQVRCVVTALGSGGSLGRAALSSGADCLICGEIHYHDALDLAQAGLSIIELGHDISEFPLTALIANEVAGAGVGEDSIVILDQLDNWAYPETIRL